MHSFVVTGAVLSVCALLMVFVEPLRSGAESGPPDAITADERRGPNLSTRVVLSYDDCPKDLEEYRSTIRYASMVNIGLVIAPTGRCLVRFQEREGVDLVRLARGYGQYVINHSISHIDLRRLDCPGVIRELGAPGAVSNYGRPPFGVVDTDVRCGYEAKRMKIWHWNLGVGDTTGRSTDEIVAYIARVAKPGYTVLMHMSRNGFNPTALRQIRERLARRHVYLCRAYRGMDNTGPVLAAPVNLPGSLPC